MQSATVILPRSPTRFHLGALLVVGAVLHITCDTALAAAADSGRSEGMLIGVSNPITDGVVSQIKNKIEDAFRNRRGPKAIIFDFNPANGPASTIEPYPCLALADFLSDLRSRTRPVAFVHDKVMGHTVLPVLACPTLIMSEDAALGDVLLISEDAAKGGVLRGQLKPLSETVLEAYRKFGKMKTSSPDLITKMLDKKIAIYKSQDGKRFRDRARIKEAERERFSPMPGLERGVVLFKAEDALATGLCNRILNTLNDVAREEDLSEAGLRQGVLPGPKNAWLVEMTGDVTRATVHSARRKIKNAVGKGGNFFIIVLECQGGDPIAAADFAEFLRQLKDDKDAHAVETVAFVPPGKKLEAATAIALGCTEIVMSKDAVLGDFESLKGADAAVYRLMRESLVGLAKAQRYPALLIDGTLDPDLVIYQVRSKTDPNYHFLLSKQDFEADQAAKKPKWEYEKPLKQNGQLRKIDSAVAQEYGVARTLLEDEDAVERYYNLEKVQRTSSDLLDDIQTFFRYPGVRVALIMIGIIGLILEMKMPGVGLPGVVAAICFVLFFWASSNVSDFTWLAILLFALGLILIGLEVFFLPGMAVFGISGVVLVVGSLVLVTLERAPTTTHAWFSLGMTLTTYTFTLIGAMIGAFVIARFLPQIPYANRLVLIPPSERTEEVERERLAQVDDAASALLGAIGEAATALRPAGKARFGDQFLDVVAEGSFVSSGKRVQVIEIEGNRIVVKEV